MYPDDKTWWGDFQVAMGTAARLCIGPATILIQRLQQEWRIATEVSTDPDELALDIEIPAELTELLERANVRRFVASNDSENITITARLADRPVVATPQKPVELPPGEAVTVYVGSPVWMHVHAGTPVRDLFEVPLQPPADTWFGPSTRVGELCYASRTHCRLSLDELPLRPHRAVTSVVVENQAATPLRLDALKLPVPHLALYSADDGRLWTQDVTLTRDDDHEFTPLRVREGAPRQAENAMRIAEPRQPVADNIMVRAFSSLFSL